MSEQFGKDILVISALNPTDTGVSLEYENLDSRIHEYTPEEAVFWRLFSDADEDTIDQEAVAERLASFYLLKTAGVILVSKDNQNEAWPERFINATQELYGSNIDHTIWRGQFVSRVDKLQNLANQEAASQLLGLYADLGLDLQKQSEVGGEKLPLPDQEWSEFFLNEFSSVLELVREGETYTPSALQALFVKGIEILQNDGKFGNWEEWKIEVDGSRSALMVSASEKKIIIGGKRANASSKKAKYLLGHELLTHALRAQRGYMKDSELLAKGMPGYLDAEEGLAIVNGYIASGDFPQAIIDRYIDTGIALGHLGVVPSRQDMVTMDYLRRVCAGKNADPLKAATKYVNRIYRGGPGTAPRGTIQPVFTKDVVYFQGYKKIVAYINCKIKEGTKPTEIFDILYQGKIDPTQNKHLSYASRSRE